MKGNSDSSKVGQGDITSNVFAGKKCEIKRVIGEHPHCKTFEEGNR